MAILPLQMVPIRGRLFPCTMYCWSCFNFHDSEDDVLQLRIRIYFYFHLETFQDLKETVCTYIENIRKMSTKNLKPKTSEKPLENLWFLVFEHIRNMSTRVRFSKTF